MVLRRVGFNTTPLSLVQEFLDERLAASQSLVGGVSQRRFVLEALQVRRAAARIAAYVTRSFLPSGDDGAPSSDQTRLTEPGRVKLPPESENLLIQ